MPVSGRRNGYGRQNGCDASESSIQTSPKNQTFEQGQGAVCKENFTPPESNSVSLGPEDGPKNKNQGEVESG
jgi:hypothetical protein